MRLVAIAAEIGRLVDLLKLHVPKAISTISRT
jgi:hypothetical protein